VFSDAGAIASPPHAPRASCHCDPDFRLGETIFNNQTPKFITTYLSLHDGAYSKRSPRFR